MKKPEKTKSKTNPKSSAKKPAVKNAVVAKKPVKKTAAKPVAKKTVKAAPKKTVLKKAPAPKVAPKPVKKTTVNKTTASAIVKKPVVSKSAIVKKNPTRELSLAKTIEKPEQRGRQRFSDQELQEFKEIIRGKLEEARRDLQLLTEAFSNSAGQDIQDTAPTFKILEEGSQVLSKEENSQLALRQAKFIKALENALIRIENKTYGVCRVTGMLISKERLRSVPHATLSIEAKLQQHIRKD